MSYDSITEENIYRMNKRSLVVTVFLQRVLYGLAISGLSTFPRLNLSVSTAKLFGVIDIARR